MTKRRWRIGTPATLGIALALWATPVAAQNPELVERIIENHFEFIPSGDGPFPTLIAFAATRGHK